MNKNVHVSARNPFYRPNSVASFNAPFVSFVQGFHVGRETRSTHTVFFTLISMVNSIHCPQRALNGILVFFSHGFVYNYAGRGANLRLSFLPSDANNAS